MNRIFFSDNGTLTDYSTALDDYHAGDMTVSVVAAEDAIYIGSWFPFNSIYFKMGSTVNANASVMSVDYWVNSEWIDAVELIDETSSGGATLAQSGHITFVTDKNSNWTRESTNASGESITGLTDVVVYDRYWIKINFSADLTANMIVDWAGALFSNDNDLGTEHPNLLRSNVLTRFEAGKTTWEEQHVLAAKKIIDYFKSKNVICDGGQLLQRRDMTDASVAKVAEIAYNGLGESKADEKEDAQKEFHIRVNRAMPKVDHNLNARTDVNETVVRTGRVYR